MPDDLNVPIGFTPPLRTPTEAAEHLQRFLHTFRPRRHDESDAHYLEVLDAAYVAYDERRLRLTERELLRVALALLHEAWVKKQAGSEQ